MEGWACESEAWVSSNGSIGENPDEESLTTPQLWRTMSCGSGFREKKKSGTNKKNQVLLEGYVESVDEDDLTRTKSLTDEDLDELKGCLDLGFGFSYDEIPELCNTLPALELCYSMSQKYMDEHQKSPDNSVAVSSSASDSCSSVSSPIANWKISSPGDHPEDVKARLKYWAQAVACTPRPSCGACSSLGSTPGQLLSRNECSCNSIIRSWALNILLMMANGSILKGKQERAKKKMRMKTASAVRISIRASPTLFLCSTSASG
ncbi:hypothetical protein PanWU01x14_046850 [Parasponia andersonii]|uniref:Uncharacterized protein n=1 Tax=Parasponia andersonii TaxID=3476 RepID=A0A2P5DNW0_PARAD|nr:hypothetical protein PanWU01x14_046850 [Parasponia andersonii]